MIRQPHIRYVCPTANAIPVTLNGGMRMPSWFDVFGLDMKCKEDVDGIKAAADLLQKYIAEEEKKGIDRSRIVVGGFSQGGAVALYSALTYDKPPLAGIVALSTWLPLAQGFPQAAKANKETPIFQAHGLADPIVNYNFGKITSELVKSFNSKLEFKSYQDMGHSSCQKEMDDVKKFIDTHLPSLKPQ
ncbi:hypothetical protein LSH36_68g05012 [Paralvinella palmiformis]|uniref:palmitoyl-protein hydrolase n=1 Tax=Paralvinella palmiformis TaxID=53620 RepID=A0AAD9K388_9ANNE|nr:hypothetical protein LSH36_68g05012 [Paralvinella palmiformis]